MRPPVGATEVPPLLRSNPPFMDVVFLAPDIHSLPTGGNIYNRRVLAELDGSVHLELWPVERAPEDPGAVPGADVVVVDSLLLAHGEALDALRRAQPRGSFVLLAHYLNCIDPTQSDTATAQRERKRLRLFDGAITTSQYVRRALAGETLDRESIAVVPPGLDDGFREPVPDRPGATGRPLRLLTVANVLPGKGLRRLLRGLEALADASWRWTLVGDETLDRGFATDFRQRLAASSVADRVHLAGAVPEGEMRPVYDAHDVCVVPSRFETCSMSTREAMARGLAVVATRVGGLPENFGMDPRRASPDPAPTEWGGYLVDAGRLPGLVEALRTVLHRPVLRARMAQAARRQSQTFPTWSETGRRFEAALQEWVDVLT